MMCDKLSFHLTQLKLARELRKSSITDISDSGATVSSGVTSLQAQDVLLHAVCPFTCLYSACSGFLIFPGSGICASLQMHALFQLQLCQQEGKCPSLLLPPLLEVTPSVICWPGSSCDFQELLSVKISCFNSGHSLSS